MSNQTILISKGWVKPLDKAIAKWELLASDITAEEPDCALCDFDSKVAAKRADLAACLNCPICIDTGATGCTGTAYFRWSEAEGSRATKYAREMRRYIKDLKARCKVMPGLKRNRVQEDVKW